MSSSSEQPAAPTAGMPEVIEIRSCPRREFEQIDDVPPRCVLSWGDWHELVPAEAVVRMAGNLMAVAAQADLFSLLFRIDVPLDDVMPPLVRTMAAEAKRAQTDVPLWTVAAAGYESRQGAVMVAVRPTVVGQRASRSGTVTPAAARAMAAGWIAAATSCATDELMAAAMHDVGGLDTGQIDRVLLYVEALRGLRDEPDEVRAARLGELRGPAAPGNAG